MSSEQLGSYVAGVGLVYRCAWCHSGDPVPGGLLYYRHAEVDGSSAVLPADPGWWARSHGICPAHLRAVECEISSAVLEHSERTGRGAASRSATG